MDIYTTSMYVFGGEIAVFLFCPWLFPVCFFLLFCVGLITGMIKSNRTVTRLSLKQSRWTFYFRTLHFFFTTSPYPHHPFHYCASNTEDGKWFCWYCCLINLREDGSKPGGWGGSCWHVEVRKVYIGLFLFIFTGTALLILGYSRSILYTVK